MVLLQHDRHDSSAGSNVGRVAFQEQSRPVVSAASLIGCATQPVFILAIGLGFATRSWTVWRH